jgi:hypothetical protein
LISEQTRDCKSCEKTDPALFDRCPCNSCIYKKELANFQLHPIGNTNFTLFQYGIAKDRDIIIIDEAHNLRTDTMVKESKLERGTKSYVIMKCAADAFKVLLLTATPIIKT